MHLTSQIICQTCIWVKLLEHQPRTLHLLANRGHSHVSFSLAASSLRLGYFLGVCCIRLLYCMPVYFIVVKSCHSQHLWTFWAMFTLLLPCVHVCIDWWLLFWICRLDCTVIFCIFCVWTQIYDCRIYDIAFGLCFGSVNKTVVHPTYGVCLVVNPLKSCQCILLLDKFVPPSLICSSFSY